MSMACCSMSTGDPNTFDSKNDPDVRCRMHWDRRRPICSVSVLHQSDAQPGEQRLNRRAEMLARRNRTAGRDRLGQIR